MGLVTSEILFQCSRFDYFNPLMPGGNKKVTHTKTKLKAAGLFKYV